MLTGELLRKIRRIELRTRRLVNERFAGSYHAVFKGRGMAFDAVRAYMPGDDVRDIDWNVTARSDTPYVKRYVEERELSVMLLLDTSASVAFGTVGQPKRDVAVELGAVLALAAVSNNDKVGLMLFSDQTELYLPPKKGRNHVLRLIRELLAARPVRKGTDLSQALRAANRFLKRRSIIFVLSDFLAPAGDYVRDLQLIARRHDVIAVTLSDPLEKQWPDVGLVALQDAEAGIITWADTSQKSWREGFVKQARRFEQARETAFYQAEVDRINVSADGDYVQALTAFFGRRMQR